MHNVQVLWGLLYPQCIMYTRYVARFNYVVPLTSVEAKNKLISYLMQE